MNITREQAADMVGGRVLEDAEAITLALYARASERCARAGISDPNEQFASAPAGGTLSNGNKTLTIDTTTPAFTGNVQFSGAGGSRPATGG